MKAAGVLLLVLLALFVVETQPVLAKEKTASQSTSKDPASESDTKEEEKVPAPYFADKKVTLYTGYEDYYSFLRDVDEEATVKYKSSKKKVATVDADGIIHPVGKGKATITATVKTDGATSKCTMSVTVKDPYYEFDRFPEGVFVGSDTVYSVKRYGYKGPVSFKLTGSQYASIETGDATSCVIHAKKAGNISVEVTSLGVTKKLDVRIYEGKGTVFVVHPDSEPYLGRYVNRYDYNEYTSCYFMLRSYLERLETLGGGMLALKKGYYPVIATLCVPSDTTILFEDGAVIKKIDNTNTKVVPATTSLFQCVASTHTTKAFKGYGGEHDISFIGEGRSGIDLCGIKCTAIMMCHNKNIKIRNLFFKNVNGLHFIEMDASRDVDISYNWFTGYTATSTGHKEAINIDTPDRNTGGFVQGWTSYDKTPNKNIYITDNVFKDLEVGIGTHRYSQTEPEDEEKPAEMIYHTGISVLRNSFFNVTTYGVRLMNWKNSVVRDNSFEETNGFIRDATVVDEEGNSVAPKLIGVYVNGAVNPIITENYFSGFDTVISCAPQKNSKIKSNPNINGGSIYDITYNEFGDETLEYMRKNYVKDCANEILIYETYGKAGTVTPTQDAVEEAYNLTP
ncbi:MAG: Ig-like domain-containing protein [Lachnospiraceae bacterium]|nr:Ig-like domain-containing protein [Lachnospiraceae bacterium]